MKKLVFLIIVAICSSLFASNYSACAQVQYDIPEAFNLYLDSGQPAEGIVPNMMYRDLKKIYRHNNYVPCLGDRYNPTLCAVASFFIPGLGQIISHQNRRGVAHLASALTFAAISTISGGLSYLYQSQEMILASVLASCVVLSLQISSCVDAVRVAKVMNMYERDLRKKNIIEFNLHPSVDLMRSSTGQIPVVGMSMGLNF